MAEEVRCSAGCEIVDSQNRVAGRRRPYQEKPQLALDEPEHDIAKLEARSIAAEQSVLAAEMSALLGRLIVALPAQLRDVITLSTVQELSPAEIGQVLGIPESAVRSRQFRAREILKEKIASLLEGKHGR